MVDTEEGGQPGPALVGEPVAREQWDSTPADRRGRNDGSGIGKPAGTDRVQRWKRVAPGMARLWARCGSCYRLGAGQLVFSVARSSWS